MANACSSSLSYKLDDEFAWWNSRPRLCLDSPREFRSGQHTLNYPFIFMSIIVQIPIPWAWIFRLFESLLGIRAWSKLGGKQHAKGVEILTPENVHDKGRDLLSQ